MLFSCVVDNLTEIHSNNNNNNKNKENSKNRLSAANLLKYKGRKTIDEWMTANGNTASNVKDAKDVLIIHARFVQGLMTEQHFSTILLVVIWQLVD